MFEWLADAGDDIMPVGSTEAPGRDTTNAAQADHGDGQTALAVSPNTWGSRSIIHYESVRQWRLSVKRGRLAVRTPRAACCSLSCSPAALLDLEKQMLP